MIMIADAQKPALYNLVKEHTNPATDFELSVINKIVGIEKLNGEWRFEKNLICTKCHRELTILDYFFSGLNHHSLQFIQDSVCPDRIDGKCKNPVSEEETVSRVDVIDHEMPIACINCGTMRPSLTYAMYVHPACAGAVIRMSTSHCSYFESKLKIEMELPKSKNELGCPM
jgi:uncharacterized CHY-type Zn-finger protein